MYFRRRQALIGIQCVYLGNEAERKEVVPDLKIRGNWEKII